MMRDKPKFFIPQNPGDSGPSAAAQSSGNAGDAAPESEGFTPFLAGERPSDLPVFNPGPRPDSEDENSPDLNLSKENRERALSQGVPSSATGRAAMEMFRQPAGEPSTAESARAGTDSTATDTTVAPSAAENTPSAAPSAPDAVDPLLSRASTNFERSQVSTAADSLGETRGITDNELVLHREDSSQAQNTIRQELSRQSQAEEESSRRADHAQSTLETSRGRERELNIQRDQLESAKAGQRSNADETQRLVEADQQRLDQNSRGVQQLQSAGEASLARINSLDSQVEQSAQARDQAGSDLQSSEQSIQSLQNQVEGLQRQAPSPPKSAGNSEKSNGAAGAKAEQQAAAAAQSQQAITSAQAQMTQAQKQQEDARRRQQEAESQLQSSQQAATRQREQHEQLRAQLEGGVQARNASQSVAQEHKAQLQQDLDRVKDLSGHNQDINDQFDDIADAKARAQASLANNRANAGAARQNVEQLRSLSADSAFEDRGKTNEAQQNSGQPTATDVRPNVTVSTGESGTLETTGATTVSHTPSNAGLRGPGPSVQDQGQRTVVRLASLNQGNNSSITDTSSGASKRRSGIDGGDDLGAASLAAAQAASSPSSTQTASADSFRDSGRGGDQGKGNGPPAHSNAGGNGKGKGRD
jgi:hypothetical protein